jgi:hypothetical protein
MPRRLTMWVLLVALVPAFTVLVAWWIHSASPAATWISAITASSALVAAVAGLIAAVAGARAADAARTTASHAADALGYSIKPQITIEVAPYGIAQRQPRVRCVTGFGAVDLEYECHYRNGRMFVASRESLGGTSDPAGLEWTIKDVGQIWDRLKDTFAEDLNRQVLRYSDERRAMRWEIVERCVPQEQGERRQLERTERRIS